MAQVKASYETVMILSTKLGEEGIKNLFEKFQNLIAEHGTVDSVEDWGKRRLAYEIQKVNEGFYSFTTFEAPASAPAEIEARMRIMENVLRYLIIRKEA